MRVKIIDFLKNHPGLLKSFWNLMGVLLKVYSAFVPINDKQIMFASFGGRKFDDSPKALYERICSMPEFKGWNIVWAFVDPDKYDIPRGEKVKIDTYKFFKSLLSSRVWISNSGMSRGIELHRKGIIEVETWHGTPLKKIGGEEHQNSMAPDRAKKKRKLDDKTIRCAQSEFDLEIFQRIFSATKNSFCLSDLPRNDRLLRYSKNEKNDIRTLLGIPESKKVLLYVPTYREYLVDENRQTFLAPPVNLEKWKNMLGGEYVLLFRAHYAVRKAMNFQNDGFVIDVTDYPDITDLYIIADVMISDYSSTYFDFSILNRPMLCFAYDLKEYEEKRGLYLDLEAALPCPIDQNEDSLIKRIKDLDYTLYSNQTRQFHEKYAPNAGMACESVIKKILERL